jgi:DNA-binding NarL/FixJ family response regulator
MTIQQLEEKELGMEKHIRVLIVDNQRRARRGMRALLATWTAVAEIREAENGRDALRLVGEWQPDVIVIDVQIPEVNGLEVTRLVKARLPQVRVVTLAVDPDCRAGALAAGADAFVCKCEPPERLLTMLSGIVGDQ